MSEKDGFEKQEGQVLWLPVEEGQELMGEVVAVDTEGSYGIQYAIRTKDGDELRTPSHKVLQSRMTKVDVGDQVKIIFKGEDPPKVKGQNPTKMYEVFLKKKK